METHHILNGKVQLDRLQRDVLRTQNLLLAMHDVLQCTKKVRAAKLAAVRAMLTRCRMKIAEVDERFEPSWLG